MLNNIVLKNYKKQAQKEKEQLVAAIEEARQELNQAREYFNLVSDDALVNYAIYLEEAAKAKYIYLIQEFKKLDLRYSQVNNEYFEVVG